MAAGEDRGEEVSGCRPGREGNREDISGTVDAANYMKLSSVKAYFAFLLPMSWDIYMERINDLVGLEIN